MRVRKTSTAGDVGFQIAPMIDVVFVILVFFMALAAQIRLERLLQTKLPGVARTDGPTEFFDEQIIQIDEAGGVLLNDEPYDVQGPKALPQLTSTLHRLKLSSDAAQAKVVVTIVSHPDSRYERTIDVLNALAAARIRQVTFTTGAGLEP